MISSRNVRPLTRGFLLLAVFLLLPSQLHAAGAAKPPQPQHWPFDGITGQFDRPAIQRGLQVYKEVCASCHGLDLVAYRNLADVGFSEAEIKAIAAEKTVMDGPDEAGDMFERPALPADRFVNPFPNDNAARASNGGAMPPDLSLMVKARADGANYLHSLLTGYKESAPEGVTLAPGQYYNPYFSLTGGFAMAPPLSADLVEYQDGTVATVEQMSLDVVQFLQWAAEPEMEQRKRMGIKVLLYLLAFTGLFYVAKNRIWSSVK